MRGERAARPWPLLIPLLLFAATFGAATFAAPAAGPSRPGIDIEGYRFELTLRDDTDEIAGRTTVTLRFTADGVAQVPLDLIGRGADGRGMEVVAVTSADGQTALTHRHENDLLTIHLPQPGTTGTLATFTVDYRGVPASGLRIGPNKHGERTFFSDNWPNRARNWLPTVDHIGDKATCEFVVTAPAHYQVVSNGRLVEETDVGDGMRLTHWQQSVPISPWLYVVGVARFAVQHLGEFKGVPVQTWVYARDRDAGFYDFAVPTMEVLHFYEEYVGPFAYDKLANITSPATGGGMEAATALMYGENSVTGERSVRWRNVIIHEIAHQWFGNAVTESEWDDVWLSEGFATYFTLLFREHAYGRDDFVTGLKEAADSRLALVRRQPRLPHRPRRSGRHVAGDEYRDLPEGRVGAAHAARPARRRGLLAGGSGCTTPAMSTGPPPPTTSCTPWKRCRATTCRRSSTSGCGGGEIRRSRGRGGMMPRAGWSSWSCGRCRRAGCSWCRWRSGCMGRGTWCPRG